MITTPVEEVKKMKGRDLIAFTCDVCGIPFTRTKREARREVAALNGKAWARSPKLNACGPVCGGKVPKLLSEAEGPKVMKTNCSQCGISITKRLSEVRRSVSGKLFCGLSCSNTYGALHKTHGTRISKLEIWIAGELKRLYPYLELHFNRKDAIESELDIYIPSLKLAFELNGIFHYEPIYGDAKLTGVQNNDRRKFSACSERGISLCIIDTSKQKYFKLSTCLPYLDIITKIINEKLESKSAS